MEEQKHTPEEVIKGYNSLSMIATKQWITKRVYNRLYVSIPIDNSTSDHAIAQIYDEEYAELIARAPELLEKVAALTKEVERLKERDISWEHTDNLRNEINDLNEIIKTTKWGLMT